MEQRSMLRFEETIKSKVTQKNYTRDIDLFRKFIGAKDYDSILSIPKEKNQESIEEYLVHLKKTKNPNSVKAYFYGVKHFFVMNRISMDWDIISKMFPETRKTTGDKAWTTEHVQKMLDSAKSKRNRALIHFLASTGCRIGVLDHDLKIKNIFDADSGCKGVVFYSGFKEEYYSFLTPEAVQSLEEYHMQRKQDGEKFNDDTPLFRLDYSMGSQPVIPLNSTTAKKITYRILKNTGIQRKHEGFASEIQQNHGFRKRFNTILKVADVNYNIAEKLMGHKNGLDAVYFKPTREECFKEFRKVITELSIDDSIRLEEEIKNRDAKIQELESDKTKIAQLEAKMENIQELLKRISN